MNLQQRLESILQKRNISNYKLAKQLNVSKTTVANWLQGVSSPDSQKLLAIAEYLNVSTDYLLGLTSIENSIPDAGYKISESGHAMLELYEQLPEFEQGVLLGRAREAYERCHKETHPVYRAARSLSDQPEVVEVSDNWSKKLSEAPQTDKDL